jgi:hypothetical protein
MTPISDSPPRDRRTNARAASQNPQGGILTVGRHPVKARAHTHPRGPCPAPGTKFLFCDPGRERRTRDLLQGASGTPFRRGSASRGPGRRGGPGPEVAPRGPSLMGQEYPFSRHSWRPVGHARSRTTSGGSRPSTPMAPPGRLAGQRAAGCSAAPRIRTSSLSFWNGTTYRRPGSLPSRTISERRCSGQGS